MDLLGPASQVAYVVRTTSHHNASRSRTQRLAPRVVRATKHAGFLPAERLLHSGRRAPLLRFRRSRPDTPSVRVRTRQGSTRAQTSEDLYELLGVTSTADKKQLKSAYRKMALKYHPDVNKQPDAEASFQRIKSAYNTLSDPDLRADYDRKRSGAGAGGWPFGDYTSASTGRRQAGYRPQQQEEEFYGFEDFFNDLDKELNSFNEKVKSKQGSGTAPKSLWEELADVGIAIGEDFLEFLEEGLDEEEKKRSSGSSSDGSGTGSSASDAYKPGKESGSSSSTNGKDAKKSPGDDVEDMLNALKKQMGL